MLPLAFLVIWRDCSLFSPSVSLSSHRHTRIFFSVSISFFLLWCTTTIIGGWQQITTARAIRRHCRYFCRIIIIVLSRSGLSFLRSSTLLVLPSTRRLHRSRCFDQTSITTDATVPSFDIYDFFRFLYFFLKRKPRASIFSIQHNVEFSYNYRWMSIEQCFFFFLLIQQQVWTCKRRDSNPRQHLLEYKDYGLYSG